MPVMPVPPAVVPVVPMMPTRPPTGMPAMPAISPAAVPTPTTIVMRLEITVTVARPVPAVAPFVADIGALLNVGSLRSLTRNGDRHRGRGNAGERNGAERGQPCKCRNKFHMIHLLTSGWRVRLTSRFGALPSFNIDEQAPVVLRQPLRQTWRDHDARFPIFNQGASNGALIATHQFQWRWRVR